MHAALELMLEKASRENIARENADPAPSAEQVEREAAFLKKWAKKKPIRRESSGSRFWACGRNMTQISFKMADALVAAGYATLKGDARNAGATLTMK